MLVTLSDLKVFLGVTDGSKDAIITMLGEQASAFVEKVTGISFEEKTDVVEEYDGTGTRELVLRHMPVTNTTDFVLKEANSTDNDGVWDLIDPEDYFVDRFSGIVKGNFRFRERFNSYQVTYSYGYSETPADVQNAVCMLVSAMYNTTSAGSGSGNAKSERIGDYAITYKGIEEVANTQEQVMLILNQYIEVDL